MPYRNSSGSRANWTKSDWLRKQESVATTPGSSVLDLVTDNAVHEKELGKKKERKKKKKKKGKMEQGTGSFSFTVLYLGREDI